MGLLVLRRGTWFWALWLLLIGVIWLAAFWYLFDKVPFSPKSPHFVVADAYGPNELWQPLRVERNGLARIDFWAAAPQGDVKLQIHLRRDVVNGRDIYSRTILISSKRLRCYTFTFPMIEVSQPVTFFLGIGAPGADAEAAPLLAFERGDARDGVWLNGERAGGSLALTPYYHPGSYQAAWGILQERWSQVVVLSKRVSQYRPAYLKGWAFPVLVLLNGCGCLFFLTVPFLNPYKAVWWSILGLFVLLTAGGIFMLRANHFRFTDANISASALDSPILNPQPYIVRDFMLDAQTPRVTFLDTSAELVHPTWYEIAGRRWPVLQAHAMSRLAYQVTVPDHACLEFGVALSPDTWDEEGDGVDFVVTAISNEGEDVLYRKVVDPFHNPEDQTLFQAKVDLSAYANKAVLFTFVTYPRGNNNWDWAGWIQPALVVYP